jgi:hypothetical protein
MQTSSVPSSSFMTTLSTGSPTAKVKSHPGSGLQSVKSAAPTQASSRSSDSRTRLAALNKIKRLDQADPKHKIKYALVS